MASQLLEKFDGSGNNCVAFFRGEAVNESGCKFIVNLLFIPDQGLECVMDYLLELQLVLQAVCCRILG